jgi:hypothetical protein
VFKVGDLVMYLPFTLGSGGWVMYESIGIVLSVNKFNERGKIEYKIKWINNYSETKVAGDFLVLLEDMWNIK